MHCDESHGVNLMTWRKGVLSFFGLVFLYAAFNLSSFTLTNPNHFPKRQPGNSLQGYWSLEGTHGCFDNAYVYVDGNTEYVRLGLDNKLEMTAELETLEVRDGALKLNRTTKKTNNYQELELIDLGDKLVIAKMLSTRKGGGKLHDVQRLVGKTYLKRCNIVSNKGYASIAFGTAVYKVPDPNELDNTLIVKRDSYFINE